MRVGIVASMIVRMRMAMTLSSVSIMMVVIVTMIVVMVNVIMMPVRVRLMLVSVGLVRLVMNVTVVTIEQSELRRGHAGTRHPCRVDVVPPHGEAAQRSLQILERQTGVEHGAEHHVARDARETIEVQQLAHRWPIALRLQ